MLEAYQVMCLSLQLLSGLNCQKYDHSNSISSREIYLDVLDARDCTQNQLYLQMIYASSMRSGGK
jgi:hypothetical protein